MTKRIIIWLLIALPVFFYSCEYELENTNFVEIKQPDGADIKVSLNAPINEKGEYVVKYEYLRYKIDVPDKDDYFITFILTNELTNEQWGMGYSNTYFHFSVYPGKYKLQCVISASSNTGSIAELAGYEYKGKTFEWKLDIQRNPTPSLNLRYEKQDKTTFKIIWDKPDPYYGEIDYYRVMDSWNGYFNEVVSEPFYIVTIPEGNALRCDVEAYFKDNFLNRLYASIYIYNEYNY
jgi:hypothetical protein